MDVESRFDLGPIHSSAGIVRAPAVALGEMEELVQQDKRVRSGLGCLARLLHRCHQVLDMLRVNLN